jgi:hypothetical protein
MPDDAPDAQLEHLRALAGTWTTEGAHPLLPEAKIRGRASFEWLDGEKFLIWRSHYEHPDIPDAIAVIGVLDDGLAMQYFDTRGVHRVYSVSAGPGVWRFWRDDPDFRQRYTNTFDDTGDLFTSSGQLCRDGATWDDDLQLTYRRAGQGTDVRTEPAGRRAR